jgi:hypothetical protein
MTIPLKLRYFEAACPEFVPSRSVSEPDEYIADLTAEQTRQLADLLDKVIEQGDEHTLARFIAERSADRSAEPRAQALARFLPYFAGATGHRATRVLKSAMSQAPAYERLDSPATCEVAACARAASCRVFVGGATGLPICEGHYRALGERRLEDGEWLELLCTYGDSVYLLGPAYDGVLERIWITNNSYPPGKQSRLVFVRCAIALELLTAVERDRRPETSRIRGWLGAESGWLDDVIELARKARAGSLREVLIQVASHSRAGLPVDDVRWIELAGDDRDALSIVDLLSSWHELNVVDELIESHWARRFPGGIWLARAVIGARMEPPEREAYARRHFERPTAFQYAFAWASLLEELPMEERLQIVDRDLIAMIEGGSKGNYGYEVYFPLAEVLCRGNIDSRTLMEWCESGQPQKVALAIRCVLMLLGKDPDGRVVSDDVPRRRFKRSELEIASKHVSSISKVDGSWMRVDALLRKCLARRKKS